MGWVQLATTWCPAWQRTFRRLVYWWQYPSLEIWCIQQGCRLAPSLVTSMSPWASLVQQDSQSQCAGTCRHMCRHLQVPTSVILIIWTFLFANWDVLACVSTWKSADTWEGADTSRCRHVPTSLILILWTFLFANWYVLACGSTWKSADTWEGADTSRCPHVPTSLILIIWTFLFGNWDVLTCVSTWKSADTWEGADTCPHV